MAKDLLTYPSLVESPFIIAKIGDYSFGSYGAEKLSDGKRIIFPNYIKSLRVTKVNGTVNQYVLDLEYKITPGSDPNYIDKILSTVGYGKIKLSYGDWACPTFVYLEEEALITSVKTNVNFLGSLITYTLNCVSCALNLLSTTRDFPGYTGSNTRKPSEIIISLLNDLTTGLQNIFPGMTKTNLSFKAFIATDDKAVNIPAYTSTDILTYIKYLVDCMIPDDVTSDDELSGAKYFLTIYDDADATFGGSYFKVRRVDSSYKSLATPETFEVDINFPGDTLVTSFNVNDDNSWALLYKYSGEIALSNYVYKVSDDGITYSDFSPNITTSAKYKDTTAYQKLWWTEMTQFPIQATMTIKGLLRPAMLMSYVKVNALFYGQRHVASGLYIITKLEDSINGSGYRTTLSLTRISGDDDYQQTGVNKVVW